MNRKDRQNLSLHRFAKKIRVSSNAVVFRFKAGNLLVFFKIVPSMKLLQQPLGMRIQ